MTPREWTWRELEVAEGFERYKQALSKTLGHAGLNMNEKYAHLGSDQLRNEITRTERPASGVGPVVGTMGSAGDQDAGQVVDSKRVRRGRSVAEQQIHNPARRRRTRTQSNA